MTYRRDRYTPTQDETEAIERAGVQAAWLALQPLKDPQRLASRGVVVCLRAFDAARAAAQAAAQALAASHRDCDGVSHDIDETRMVCMALCGLDASDPGALLSYADGGLRIATLFQAGKALEAMAAAHSAFDGDNAIFGTHVLDETTQLAEAEMLRWEWKRLSCSNDESRRRSPDDTEAEQITRPLHV
jgi:hypothetical protein